MTSISSDDGKPRDPIVQDVPVDLEADLEQPFAPDQLDKNSCTTKHEIWAYYSCVLLMTEEMRC
jgi:hypothetical protein